MKYEKNIHLRWLLFRKFQALLRSAVSYYLNFYLLYFHRVLNGPPEAYKLFPFYKKKKHFNILLRLVAFQNKVAEIRVEYLGRQVLDPCTFIPLTEKCVCVLGEGGRIGAPDDLSDANTNFENF